MSKKLFLITLWLMLGGVWAHAATTLRDYAERLKQSQLALESLRQNEDGENSTTYERRSTVIVTYVRREIPPEETLETPAGNVTTANQWLDEALQEYERQIVGSREANQQLELIALRLVALRDSVLAYLAAVHKTGPTKDEEKARLETILRRPEYNAADPQQNALARLIKRVKDYLSSLLPKRAVPLNDEQVRRASPATQLIVYAILLAVIALAAWRIVPLLRRRAARTRRAKNVKPKARVVLGETLAEDETALDLFAQAELLAQKGDWRAAIRKGHIAALCALSDRKLLRLEQHKTNYDYLREIAAQPNLSPTLRRLTQQFEYHWYGLAPADATAWDAFRNSYQFLSK